MSFDGKMRNEVVWFFGADDGSAGYEVILEQHEVDGDAKEFRTLFKIEPGGDAMSIGYMVGSLEMSGGIAGARAMCTERDPRP